MDTGVATVFVLCEARTMALYRAIWTKIVQLAPALQDNLKSIMSDYEIAAINVMNEQFPTAKLHGCWFHFNQAVTRKWHLLGLKDAPSDVLSMTMTMALAPVEQFQEAFYIIQDEANGISNEYPAVIQFMTYLETTWLPIASKVSVYNCPTRTNNITESFHNVIVHKFHALHANIWHFLENLQNLIVDEEIKLRRLMDGQEVRRVSSGKNRIRDLKVAQAEKNLESGRLRLKQFLQLFRKVHEQFRLQENAVTEVTPSVSSVFNEEIISHDNLEKMSTRDVEERKLSVQLKNITQCRQPKRITYSTVEKENVYKGDTWLRSREKTALTRGLCDMGKNYIEQNKKWPKLRVVLRKLDHR